MMKTLLFVALTLAVIAVSHGDTKRLSEPVQQDESSTTFGAPFIEMPAFTTLTTLLEQPETYMDTTFALNLEVNKVCQKKGCFFIAQQGDASIRVSFKDYGFFVPTDIGGKQVTLIGELTKKEISQAQAEHLSKDLGEKDRVKSGVQYQIIASSVRVPANVNPDLGE